MDPNMVSQIVGLSYREKLHTEAWQKQNVEEPFVVYDALTPDEPPWVWLVIKRLLAALLHSRTTRQNALVTGSLTHRRSLAETTQ